MHKVHLGKWDITLIKLIFREINKKNKISDKKWSPAKTTFEFCFWMTCKKSFSSLLLMSILVILRQNIIESKHYEIWKNFFKIGNNVWIKIKLILVLLIKFVLASVVLTIPGIKYILFKKKIDYDKDIWYANMFIFD